MDCKQQQELTSVVDSAQLDASSHSSSPDFILLQLPCFHQQALPATNRSQLGTFNMNVPIDGSSQSNISTEEMSSFASSQISSPPKETSPSSSSTQHCIESVNLPIHNSPQSDVFPKEISSFTSSQISLPPKETSLATSTQLWPQDVNLPIPNSPQSDVFPKEIISFSSSQISPPPKETSLATSTQLCPQYVNLPIQNSPQSDVFSKEISFTSSQISSPPKETSPSSSSTQHCTQSVNLPIHNSPQSDVFPKEISSFSSSQISPPPKETSPSSSSPQVCTLYVNLPIPHSPQSDIFPKEISSLASSRISASTKETSPASSSTQVCTLYVNLPIPNSPQSDVFPKEISSFTSSQISHPTKETSPSSSSTKLSIQDVNLLIPHSPQPDIFPKEMSSFASSKFSPPVKETSPASSSTNLCTTPQNASPVVSSLKVTTLPRLRSVRVLVKRVVLPSPSISSDSTVMQNEVESSEDDVESANEEHDKQSDLDTDSSEMDVAIEPGMEHLSAFERRRLKNIRENAVFFESLNLGKTALSLRGLVDASRPSRPKRTRHSEPKEASLEKRSCLRGSKRLLALEKPLPSLEQPLQPLEKPLLSPQPAFSKYTEVRLPAEPLDFLAMVKTEKDQLAQVHLCHSWSEASSSYTTCLKSEPESLKTFVLNVHDMCLDSNHVHKFFPGRVNSITWLPVENQLIVVAGGEAGHVTIADMSAGLKGMFQFQPHVAPVSCLAFPPHSIATLLSSSYDGTLRKANVETSLWEQVYSTPEAQSVGLSMFDFLRGDGSLLLVAHLNGHVGLVDTRSQRKQCEWSVVLHSGKINAINIHPVNNNYFVSAGVNSRRVNIWDLRKFPEHYTTPVVTLDQHHLCVQSAAFSSVSGDRLITSGVDDTIRIFDTSSIQPNLQELVTIKHDNRTGRGTKPFRLASHPSRDDCFVVGSITQPRCIDLFSTQGRRLHRFSSNALSSVCSINAFHPHRLALACGNSSGKVHIFRDFPVQGPYSYKRLYY